MRFVLTLAVAVTCAALTLAINGALAQSATAASSAGTYTPLSGQAGKDVIWVPTPQALVDRMLELAELTNSDYLIDLGSGDGRTVISAAKRGVRAHGIEYNLDMVALAQRNAAAEGVSERATFERGDIFQSDFSKASVITLFLLPNLNVKLRPTLLEMRPGTRVVSNSFDMGDWQPDGVEAGEGCENYRRAMKWVVPAKVSGSWRLGDGELSLTHSYQMLSGTLMRGGEALSISEAKMDGTRITFTAGGQRYTGEVADGKMSGQVDGNRTWSATRSAG